MKSYSSVLLTLLMCTHVHAQVQSQNIDVDVDSEIDQMYHSAQPHKAATRQNSQIVSQTVVVPQQQRTSVQTQPTTLIEASPLSDSRADNIRRNRQDEELKTESKIVEKLEQSRMEDEKRRAAVLFGDRFDTMQNNQPAASPVQVAPVAPVIQPVYVEQEPVSRKENLSRDAVREEVRAALEDNSSAVGAPMESKYFAGMAGIGVYPDVNNVKGNYSLGAAFGTRYDYLMVEGAFTMSNFAVDVNNYAATQYGYRVDSYDVSQYTGSIAAKYQLMSGLVRPVLGGVIAYSYRKYALTNGYYNASQDTGYSHAIDLGVNAGVDLEFNSKFSLGFDLKYMFNMSSRVTSNYPNSSYGYVGTPLEKLQYSVTSIVARVNF